MYDTTVATTVVTLIKLEGDRSDSRGDADKSARAPDLSIALTTKSLGASDQTMGDVSILGGARGNS